MKYIIALILFLSLGAEALTITWEAPTARENGQPLAASEIGGYEIRYRVKNSTGAWTALTGIAGAATSYNFAPVGNFDIFICAYDTNGNYSKFVQVGNSAAAPMPPSNSVVK
jgi:hypothetical protein